MSSVIGGAGRRLGRWCCLSRGHADVTPALPPCAYVEDFRCLSKEVLPQFPNFYFLNKISHGQQHKNKADRAELPPLSRHWQTLCLAKHSLSRREQLALKMVCTSSLKASSYPVQWL